MDGENLTINALSANSLIAFNVSLQTRVPWQHLDFLLTSKAFQVPVERLL